MINQRTVRKAISMAKKGVPFIIIKYEITSFGYSNNIYELLFIRNERVETTPLERDDAMAIIKKLSLPVLHRLDNSNVIWGYEAFKEVYQTIKNEENDRIIFG